MTNAIQADVGGNPIEEARRIPRVQPLPLLDQPDEDILRRVERFILVAQQLAAAPQHHRSEAATEGPDVQLAHDYGYNTAAARNCYRPQPCNTSEPRRCSSTYDS